MKIEQLVPQIAEVQLSDLLTNLRGAECRDCFDDLVMEFIDSISQSVFSDADAKKFPELLALAFFMRRSNLRSMKANFQKENAQLVQVARGRIFQIAPANVDTIFVYSWALSALMGNINVVRISKNRRSTQTEILCRIINRVLIDFPKLCETVSIVSYEHDDVISRGLSLATDLRVIWGGDVTVNKIRLLPLPPTGRDLVFPDRYSFSVVHSANYLALTTQAKALISHDFFNDSYWFNQAACSSPRQIFWVGDEPTNANARAEFLEHLASELDKQDYRLDASLALNKMTDIYDSVIDLSVPRASIRGNELAVLDYPETSDLPTKYAAPGAFYSTNISALDDILPLLTKRVQTMTYCQFPQPELAAFAKRAVGRGIERIVPIGQALAFDRYWDGFDLLQEFTTTVHIK